MFNKSAFVITLVFVVGASAAVDNSPLKAEVVVIDDISKLKDLYPGAELIPISGVNTKGNILYTLGARTGYDQMVAQAADTQYYVSPQDIYLTLTYPKSRVGATLTCVTIEVGQSTNIGNAWVVSGGIGQRYIQIVVFASGTTFFSYSCLMWGTS